MGKEKYALSFDDYAQSANTLFHFMTKCNYLRDILINKAIVPRYCKEDIKYLKIKSEGNIFSEAFVLQKCFCDIPFHKLTESFELQATGDAYDSLSKAEKDRVPINYTHPDFYGEYAIAFSKRWGEKNNLQPIHYLNEESKYAKDLSNLVNQILNIDDVSDLYSNDVLNRLSFLKPLRGKMKRQFTKDNGERVEIEFQKNFHDEQEWRYVPDIAVAESLKKDTVIANKRLLERQRIRFDLNAGLTEQRYDGLWLKFSYEDIKYIIVPDANARIEVIDIIMEISNEKFSEDTDVLLQKYILISKILVLEEIRKDW